MSESQWFTVEEIADLLKVHANTVRRWIKSGDLPAVQFGGKAGYRIRRADLDAFIERRSKGER